MLIRVNPRKSVSKNFLCALCVSAVIFFNTAYSENSTTSYFNFLSLPTAPPIQQQQPPPIEKTEIPAIIDFPGGRLIGSVEDPLVSAVNSTSAVTPQLNPLLRGEDRGVLTPQSALQITGPVAFILKRTNLTTNNQQLTTGSVNPANPVKSLSGILKFTVKSSTGQAQSVAPTIIHRYPKIGYVEESLDSALGLPSDSAFSLSVSPARLALSPGDNIEIELVAQQNIVYLQIPYGEILEITNIEFLENTQLTENCNCKQVKEIDLSLLYNSFKH